MHDLDLALTRAGLHLDDLRHQAQAIALFGSRAAGCAKPGSDWDLLCIGAGRSRKLRGLDLVWVEPSAIETSAWLGGDLAGHVAAHGIWLSGSPCWDLGAVDFAAAAHRKSDVLARSLAALAGAWDLLGPAYRAKHATLVRRDVQRWFLLQQKLPIPPSATLDESWAAGALHRPLAEALVDLGAPRDFSRDLSACARHPQA
ncbi:MAG: nucleotidyltransferase domain-containing protein [Minicystis sp.]